MFNAVIKNDDGTLIGIISYDILRKDKEKTTLYLNERVVSIIKNEFVE